MILHNFLVVLHEAQETVFDETDTCAITTFISHRATLKSVGINEMKNHLS